MLTANPSFRVYYRRQCNSTSSSTDFEEDDYSLIIGIRLEHLVDSNKQLKVEPSFLKFANFEKKRINELSHIFIYSLISKIAYRFFFCISSQKFWNLVAWTLNDETINERLMASALEELDMIDWKMDVFEMRYKHYTQPLAITNFLIDNHGPRMDTKHCYPCNQYYFPMKDALNIKIR